MILINNALVVYCILYCNQMIASFYQNFVGCQFYPIESDIQIITIISE